MADKKSFSHEDFAKADKNWRRFCDPSIVTPVVPKSIDKSSTKSGKRNPNKK